MSPKFKGGLWRPSLFKLMLMIAMLSAASFVKASKRTSQKQQQGEQQQNMHYLSDSDPMEPCYLANNRASESLTISESTPVGTVVGEIMVNGDSSTNGNIELSIKMPGGSGANNGQQVASGGFDAPTTAVGGRQAVVGAQRQPATTNGYLQSSFSLQSSSSSPSTSASLSSSPSPSSVSVPLAGATKRIGFASGAEQQPLSSASNSKSARDLSSLIDLMPPLSIEQGTKRLILAKKLDRENLDRYVLAGGYQSSSAYSLPSISQSSSSSASITVHIKCQLKSLDHHATQTSLNATTIGATLSNATNTVTAAKDATPNRKISNTNSILIPIHLIVTDENDNWPVFLNSPYIIDLNETAPTGLHLTGNEIIAVDGDQQGPLSTIEYSIVPGSLWSDSFAFLNPLDSRSLVVKDNRLLDYEGQSKITLKVMARDQGEPPNWAITSLYINLYDNDDLNPIFAENKYYGQVRENRPGEVVELLPKRIVAYDGDRSINAPIMYSFHTKTNHSIHFDLDADLGQLTLKKTLPEDSSKQPFCLLVRATQIDNPQRWTLTMINIRFSQDSSPQLLALGNQPDSGVGFGFGDVFKFSQPNFTVELSESAPIGFTVLRLKASFFHQAFPTESDQVTYHLLDNEMRYFSLDERTGKLTLNRSLDYELNRHLSVRILATYEYLDDSISRTRRLNSADSYAGGGSQVSLNSYPKLACDITRVNINIINENDFSPEFSHEQYNFQLSVSDLIANFELPKMNIDEQQKIDDSGENHSNSSEVPLSKRFGELELDEPIEETLDWRAMRIGQVYCSDRDFGDRLTLQLIGSKADLFHLTQDGRLYLPLVNTSSQQIFGNTKRYDLFSSSRIINNQFVQSRFASSRRTDLLHFGQELPDRKYLNYLLGEFSNLGRLRLKVIASDDGRPKIFSSTALVVITIISIENFILQRAPQLPNGAQISHSEGAINLLTTNETSLDANHSDQLDYQDSKSHDSLNQVMMIPSTNRRSFVKISPDIITNLVAPKALNNHQSTETKFSNNSSFSVNKNKVYPIDSLNISAGIDTMQSSSSNSVLNPVVEGESTFRNNQVNSRFQPPSLLLVDDAGAKFVAMPAAIEVYNQQVQEAANFNSRDKNHSSGLRRHFTDRDTGLWHQIKSYLGYSDNEPNGFFYWTMNLSTAIMLHLIGIALIVMLILRIRSSIGYSREFTSNFWPSTFGSFPSLFGRTSSDRSVVSIFDQPVSCTYSARPTDSTRSSDSLGYPFLDRQNSPSNGGGRQFSGMANSQIDANIYQECQSSKLVSRGTVVSAISNGTYNNSKSTLPLTAAGNCSISNEVSDFQKHQNLLGHLKVTLNKVLDSEGTDKLSSDCTGQVTTRALGDDPIGLDLRKHENNNRSNIQQRIGVPFPTTLEASKILDTIVEVKASRSSTFVGFGSQRINSTNTIRKDPATVVSINVSAPKQPSLESSSSNKVDYITTKAPSGNNESSSSSDVSLVSMCSSISNKINAAVSERQGERTTDVSSIDSTILFNSIENLPTIRASNNRGGRRIGTEQENCHIETDSRSVPQPPPLPPPSPSLVQIMRKPTSRCEPKAKASNSISSHQSARRPLPQNPVHVKLRQQAAALSADQPFVITETHSTNNNNRKSGCHQINQPPTGSIGEGKEITRATEDSSSYEQSNTGRRDVSTNTSTTVLAPTPPPLPKNLPPSAIKTVSPTTSVDRGYESYQSYTSSSQQHQQQSAANQQRPITSASCHQQPYDLNNKLSERRDTTDSINKDPVPSERALPPIPPPPSVLMINHGSLITGRQAQRTSQNILHGPMSQRGQQQGSRSLVNRHQHNNPSTKSTNPSHRQAIEKLYLSERRRRNSFLESPADVDGAPSIVRQNLGESARLKRASRTLASATALNVADQPPIYHGYEKHLYQPQQQQHPKGYDIGDSGGGDRYHYHHHQQHVMGNGHGTSGKKQLTWSDQVEIA